MRRAVPLLLLAALAACAKGPPPPPPAPPGPPPGVEGRYRGTARLVRSSNPACPRSGPRVYEVQNGAVTLSYQLAGRARAPLTAPIGPDGHFETSDGTGTLQGDARDGKLEATIASRFCEHRWTMRLID